MLRNLKDLFDQLTTHLTAPASAHAPAEQEHTLQLATAVLLVEVMHVCNFVRIKVHVLFVVQVDLRVLISHVGLLYVAPFPEFCNYFTSI